MNDEERRVDDVNGVGDGLLVSIQERLLFPPLIARETSFGSTTYYLYKTPI